MSDNNQIGKRFNLVRKHYKLTMKDVAEKLYMSQPSISNLEHGTRAPSSRTIKTFCDTFGVNKTWMETGEGKMFAKEKSSEADAIVREYGLSASGAALIRAFAELISMMDKEMQEQAFRSVYRTLQSSIYKLDENPESMVIEDEMHSDGENPDLRNFSK